jgi:hypothetical protein
MTLEVTFSQQTHLTKSMRFAGHLQMPHRLQATHLSTQISCRILFTSHGNRLRFDASYAARRTAEFLFEGFDAGSVESPKSVIEARLNPVLANTSLSPATGYNKSEWEQLSEWVRANV